MKPLLDGKQNDAAHLPSERRRLLLRITIYELLPYANAVTFGKCVIASATFSTGYS
jgi:hypothetical protein